MLKNYLMMASKVYLRRKMFTAINLLCIVLTLVVLLVVTAVLETSFAPNGVESRSDRTLRIDNFSKLGKDMTMRSSLGYKLIDQYLRPMKSVEKVGIVSYANPVAVYQEDRVEKMTIRYTDATYWDILDFTLMAGRWISKEDVEKGHFVVVISGSAAKKLFSTNAAVGKKLNIRSHQYEVIGVVQDAYQNASSGEMWAALTTMPSSDYREKLDGEFSALLLGKSSADIPAMKQEVSDIAKIIVHDDPGKWTKTVLLANSKLDSFARGFATDSWSEDSGASQVMAWIVVLMFLFMLLPALNLINLNLGRMMERSAEIGVRKAFGASTSELVAQFLVENVLLSLLGCVIALACTQLFLMWLCQSGIIPYLNVNVNLLVFAYGILITLVFGFISGVVPAWRMARLDPVFALKGNT